MILLHNTDQVSHIICHVSGLLSSACPNSAPARWPAPLRAFIERTFKSITNPADKPAVELKLRQTINKAVKGQTLWTTDWARTPVITAHEHGEQQSSYGAYGNYGSSGSGGGSGGGSGVGGVGGGGDHNKYQSSQNAWQHQGNVSQDGDARSGKRGRWGDGDASSSLTSSDQKYQNPSDWRQQYGEGSGKSAKGGKKSKKQKAQGKRNED